MFFMTAMLLVSTFHENFAILRRSAFPWKESQRSSFLFLRSKKTTANGNQTIIGKRNNDDGDMVYYMYVLLLPQYIVLPDGYNFVCLFFRKFLLFVVIAWHVASSILSCQRSLITSAQDGVVRCTAASPCCAFAEPGDFWWFLGGWPHLTKPLCHCVNWWAGRARCFFDCNPADLQCFSQNFWQSLGDPFWLLTSTIKAIR